MTCDGKNIYISEHKAKAIRNSVYKKRTKRLRVYYCPKCFGWHLTSEPKWV